MIHFHEYIKRVIALRKRAQQDAELKKQDALVLKGKVWKLKEKIQKTLAQDTQQE